MSKLEKESWGVSNEAMINGYMPRKNRGTLLKRAIDSVMSQDYDNFELVVVDDGSTDGTAQLLSEAEESFRLICSDENRGYGASLKKGIRQAEYSIVAITDADAT